MLIAHDLQLDTTQKHAVEQMERHKIAVFAEFPAYDLVLVPHLNTRDCLHVIGLRVSRDLLTDAELLS